MPLVGYYEWSSSDVYGKKDVWFIHAAGPLWAAGLWKCLHLFCRRATSAPSPSSPETAATCQPTSMAISRIAASSIAQRVIA